LAVRNVERAEVDALVAAGDGDVLSATDMRLKRDWFITTKVSGFGIDFLEQDGKRPIYNSTATASELTRTQ